MTKFYDTFGVSKKTAATNLRKAAVLIETCGFVKGKYGTKDVGYCALGAIRAADKASEDASAMALRVVIGNRSISAWNDTASQTAEGVTSTIRATARALEHGLEVSL